ncbi:uncharacterized protein NPIL_438081 [Nephila pilipes]|uniref:Uncharacterized protein n=1 Tax=Nephila pilipes TaxID=299642 RepID=A0A8X6U4H9_NEPPI|nr:uncharacterized protein NPIL_438081 [Nephila pilipes]
MASCSRDWKYLAQDTSEETTVITTEQPQSCINQPPFRTNRLEVQEKDNESWCQSVFCGKKKHKRITTAMQDSLRSSEMQNSECIKIIEELNNVLAIFRDHLVQIAKQHDCPEIRDRIRENRRKCLELSKSAHEIIMPQIRNDVSEGIPVDSQQLINLVCCTQMFLRELRKCYNLIQTNPMDMTAFYEKRPRSSGVSVLDKLVLFKIQPRDYHKEELQSIIRDTEETADLLKEMKEFMPCESNDKLFADEHVTKWTRDRRKSACKFSDDWICYCGSNLE